MLGLVFSVWVLAVSAVSARQARAQTAAEVTETVEEQEVVVATGAGETTAGPVDYYLPYPGILPDHPLYWLKMVRDRVRLWLTREPLARAERLLLYADKRLGAGWALIDGEKTDLGVTTLTKAEKYLERAMLTARSLGEGAEETRFKEKLDKATAKHKEVLRDLMNKVGDEHKGVIKQMLKIGNENEEKEGKKQEAPKLMIDFGDGKVSTYSGIQADNVYELLTESALQEGWLLKTKKYDFGVLVEEIEGKKNTSDKAWMYFVNGEAGKVAADKYKLEPSDVVEWRYGEI
jgi:hypothetical protein